MANKNGGMNFLEGAVAGIALGIAASMFLSSKTGKKLKGEMGHIVADFYKYAAPRMKKMKKMGKKEYEIFMKNAVMQYGKAKKMSEAGMKELLREVQKSWSHIQKHI
jgi:gas vesicle protein